MDWCRSHLRRGDEQRGQLPLVLQLPNCQEHLVQADQTRLWREGDIESSLVFYFHQLRPGNVIGFAVQECL